MNLTPAAPSRRNVLFPTLRSAAAFLLVSLLALLIIGDSPRRAAAAPPPAVRGSYYGTFTNTRGDIGAVGLVLSWQTGRRLLGWIEGNAFVPMTQLSGSVSSAGRITLSGRGRSIRGPVRLTLRGSFVLDEDGRNATITGTFRTTGAARQQGTFTVRGFMAR